MAMLEHNREENVCLKCDDLAEQDFTYRMTESEYFRCKQNWWISLLISLETKNHSENVLTSTKRRRHGSRGCRPLCRRVALVCLLFLWQRTVCIQEIVTHVVVVT